MEDDALLLALYASVTSDDAFAAMLALLAERFRCPSAALVYVDAGRPAASVALGHGLFDAAARRRYHEHFAADDPAPAAMARLPVGVATTTDRLFDDAAKASSSRFLHEFYYPLGLREALGGPIANEKGRFGILAVHRGSERGPFEDREIAAFERIMRHVIQATRLRSAFFELEMKALVLDEALEGVPTGVMAFGRYGVLCQANAAARSILARDDGLTLTRSGRLEARDRAAQRQLRAVFDRTSDMTAPIVLRVPQSDGSGAYALRIAPLESEPGVVVRISDPTLPPGDLSGVLAKALQLPDASARLVAALVRGEDLAGYAKRTGISLNTAKFHLKTAFAATGARRQTDLVRRASAIARDLQSPPGAISGE